MPKRRTSSESLDSNCSTSTTASYQPLRSRMRLQRVNTSSRYELMHGNVALVGTFGDSQFDQTHLNASSSEINDISEQQLLFRYYHRNGQLTAIQDSDEDEEFDIENDVQRLPQSDDDGSTNHNNDFISQHRSLESNTISAETEPSEIDPEDYQESNSSLSDKSKPSTTVTKDDHNSDNDNSNENNSDSDSDNNSGSDSDNNSESDNNSDSDKNSDSDNNSDSDSDNNSDSDSDINSRSYCYLDQKKRDSLNFFCNPRGLYKQSVDINCHKDLPDEENKSARSARSLFTVHPGPDWRVLETSAREPIKVFLHNLTCTIYLNEAIKCLLIPEKRSDYVLGDFESILCTAIPRDTLRRPINYICIPSGKITLGQVLNGQYSCVLSWRDGRSYQATLVSTNGCKPKAFIVPNELIPCSIRSSRITISSVIYEKKIDNDNDHGEKCSLVEILNNGLPVTFDALFINFLIIPYQSKEVICRVCSRKSPSTDHTIKLIFYSPKTINFSLIIPEEVDKDSLLPVNSIVACRVLFPNILVPCACIRLLQDSQTVVHLVYTSILPCSIRSARLTVRYIPFVPLHRNEYTLQQFFEMSQNVYELLITTVEADRFSFEMRRAFETPWYAVQFGVMDVEENIGQDVRHWTLVQSEAGQFDQIPRDINIEAQVKVNGRHIFYCGFFSPSKTPWKGYLVDDSAPGFYENPDDRPRNPQIDFPPIDLTNDQIHELVMRRRKSMHYRMFVFYDRPLNVFPGGNGHPSFRMYAETTMTNDVDFTRISITRMRPDERTYYLSRCRSQRSVEDDRVLSNSNDQLNTQLTNQAHRRSSLPESTETQHELF